MPGPGSAPRTAAARTGSFHCSAGYDACSIFISISPLGFTFPHCCLLFPCPFPPFNLFFCLHIVSGFLIWLFIWIPFLLLFLILSGGFYAFTAEKAIWEGKKKLKPSPRAQQLGTRKAPGSLTLTRNVSVPSRSWHGPGGCGHSRDPSRTPAGLGQGWDIGDTGPACRGHSGSRARPDLGVQLKQSQTPTKILIQYLQGNGCCGNCEVLLMCRREKRVFSNFWVQRHE